jgi:catechol-2,3-dioxygenase
MAFNGVHVSLSVTDLGVSGPWYQKVFEGTQLFAGDDGVSQVELYLIPDNILIGLRQHASTAAGDSFAYDRCGMDHMALHVATRAEVESWAEKLEGLGVESSGVIDSPYGHHVNFKDPDGIALEVFAAQQA